MPLARVSSAAFPSPFYFCYVAVTFLVCSSELGIFSKWEGLKFFFILNLPTQALNLHCTLQSESKEGRKGDGGYGPPSVRHCFYA